MEQLDKLPKVTADDVTAAVKKVEDLVWCKEQRCVWEERCRLVFSYKPVFTKCICYFWQCLMSPQQQAMRRPG
jgi:hypothetical protein